jgi:hypothetical protein
MQWLAIGTVAIVLAALDVLLILVASAVAPKRSDLPRLPFLAVAGGVLTAIIAELISVSAVTVITIASVLGVAGLTLANEVAHRYPTRPPLLAAQLALLTAFLVISVALLA